MAYNYFPQTYQTPAYYPAQANAFQTQPSVGVSQPNTQSSLIWVQGEGAAKSYPVAPNQTVALWDSESQTIYLKSADASGMPNMRILDYDIRDNAPKTAEISSKSDFATREDITYLKDELSSLKSKYERIDKMLSKGRNKEQSDGK